ncbi:zinc finger and BTB domain-containing protein 37 [Latimeria chalumnae]|uniref:Zinc finger and BTB domain containing 37 n=1 Tax=Latimeria chalumnae TaxID=7897 RepID=H3BAF8_LATCH|nr:PREDICTED: zinc finger and BTB domain-containing protein 37 [Latimeria chalumnae]XP_005994138.1 PREDICTED: zinc finger and BTB domain-containing protein 37 [Latimeria chalumnae]XP_014342759.1 PREDICTED: zinc finger and BTB domain-containing protein 37 [Latimeria chalumnae]|eukprot:XP_005994136.1 PREDICTED: zinc finger and BTB domain-containing protein 37 [Latimeria chalumnae]
MEKVGSVQLEIPDFSNSVLNHLNQLRMQGRLCDIVVTVQGQSFRAHKVVLAASSPYFRDHMSLGEMSTISISVIKNPSVFEQLLSFCYTGRICLQLADIISYLTAASFLQMQHVIDRCTQILENIHFKINVADLEADLSQERPKQQERAIESSRVSTGLSRSLSPRHSTPRGLRRAQTSTVVDIQELSPLGESTSPQIIEHGSDVESREPILRINRAGQWYVETGVTDRAGRGDGDLRMLGGLRIKSENLEEWLGAENQPSGEDGSSAEEVTAMVIDTTGHVGQEGYSLGSSGAKIARPTSSEIDRFSPSGSVAVTERYREKSESPTRLDEPKQLSSKVDEQAVYGVSGYEEYIREQEVAERWFRYNPRLTCIYCGKSFNQKGSLDRHMRLHMGITPFVCRICGKKYTRKDQLEYHIRKHTGNKPFHCHVCGKSFPFQAILNQHFRKNHPGCTPLEGPHSISPETTVTSRGQMEEESPPQEEAAATGENVQPSVSTTGPD